MNHFVHSIRFEDEKGPLDVELTEDREWKVRARGQSVSFTYSINLQQSARYTDQAWGGAINYMRDNMAFLNGSFSFVIPLVNGLTSPVEVRWSVPPTWNVVTPWTTNENQTIIPSHYALVRNYYVVFREGSMFRRRIRNIDFTTVWLGEDNINEFRQAERAIERVIEAAISLFGDTASHEGITLILRDSNPSNQFRASTEANSIEFNFKKGMTFERIWRDHRDGFLRLLAHEIMHTWDRREIEHASSYLHVREWGPGTCWLREGFTEYLAMLNLYNADIFDRTGFINAMHSLSQRAQHANQYQNLSLVSACELFFQDREALQYVYSGGAALAFELDLELRNLTHGVKSLPLFMRIFMNKYRYKEKTTEAFVEEWKAYAPAPLRDIERRLSSNDVVELLSSLEKSGIYLKSSPGARSPTWEVSSNATFHWYFQ